MTDKEVFYEALEKFQNNTRFYSSLNQIVEEENFKKIISIGADAVPFILNEIEENPSLLVLALYYIDHTPIMRDDECNLFHSINIKTSCAEAIERLRPIAKTKEA